MSIHTCQACTKAIDTDGEEFYHVREQHEREARVLCYSCLKAKALQYNALAEHAFFVNELTIEEFIREMWPSWR